MIECNWCGLQSRGKRPKWAEERDLVWICKRCDEVDKCES
jgi:hypothetical protein